jgi:hypothetical protein
MTLCRAFPCTDFATVKTASLEFQHQLSPKPRKSPGNIAGILPFLPEPAYVHAIVLATCRFALHNELEMTHTRFFTLQKLLNS